MNENKHEEIENILDKLYEMFLTFEDLQGFTL